MLGAMAIYLVIAISVVASAISYAHKKKKSLKRWGWSAALVMLLIPFWDWLPTAMTHQYFCANEAGFWVNKTPAQWAKENPGVIETLEASRIPLLVSHEGDENSWTSEEMLNQRIKLIGGRQGPLPLYRWKWEGKWVDSKNNEVLARYVDFYTSYERRQAGWGGWKFWLATDHCPGYQEKALEHRKSIAGYLGAEK